MLGPNTSRRNLRVAKFPGNGPMTPLRWLDFFNTVGNKQQNVNANGEETKEVDETNGVQNSDDDTNHDDNRDEINDDDTVEDEDDDEGGWITPGNVAALKEELSGLNVEDEIDQKPVVACITTDFAMQNVILQMGLKLIAVDNGRLIKRTKQFALRCFACFKITNDLSTKFCPGCGNLRTLKRVAISVNEKGEKVININFKKQISLRGTKYSLPMPRGGKHSNNPILVADQPIPQHKTSKFEKEEKKSTSSIVSDPDYVVRSNPFAINDVYSRASRHKANRMVETKRNPNAFRKPTGN